MTLNRDKLAKIAALISSDSDSESLSAGRLADRMIREAGLTWSDVIGSESRPSHDGTPCQIKGVITVVKEAMTTKGDPMAMLSLTSDQIIYQDIIAFGRMAKWIAESVRAMPTAIFLVQVSPPTPGFRFHKVASCVRT